MWPSSPGHLTLTSVRARKSTNGWNFLAAANTTMTMRYGASAIHIRPRLSALPCWCVVVSRVVVAVDPPPATTKPLVVALASSARCSIRRLSRASSVPFGCQKRRNTIPATRPASAATMSVSSTEKKFDEKNWATAKAAPITSATGQVWRSPRLPSTIITRRRGTMIAKNGVCRPTMAPIWW